MRLILIAAFAMLLTPAAATACDCISWIAEGPHFENDITRVVESSSAIIDAVVIEPAASPAGSAIVKATRVWRGPKLRSFRVYVVSDCSQALDSTVVRKGDRVRLILHGGPQVFEASRCSNFQRAAFNRAVDRRLRNPR